MDDVTINVTGVSSIGEAKLHDTGTNPKDTSSDQGEQRQPESESTDRESE